MIDASHCRATPTAGRAKGGNQDTSHTNGGSTKLHLAVDSHGMPLGAITKGTAADCTQAMALISGFTTQNILADQGYDKDAIADQAERQAPHQSLPRIKIAKNSAAMTGRFTRSDAWCKKQSSTWNNGQDYCQIRQNTALFPAAVHMRRIFLWA